MKTVEQIVEETASKTTGGLAVPLTNAVKEWMTHAVNAYIAEQEKESETTIQYGHLFEKLGWVPEYKGKNYSTHQRTLTFGPVTAIEWEAPEPQKLPKTVRDVIEQNGGTTPTVQGWA